MTTRGQNKKLSIPERNTDLRISRHANRTRFNRFSTEIQQEKTNENLLQKRKDLIDRTRADKIPNPYENEQNKDEVIPIKKEHLKRYHEAWKNYYNNYYEREHVKKRNKKIIGSAAIRTIHTAMDERTGNLSRKQAVKNLNRKIKNHAIHHAKKVKQTKYFWPSFSAIMVVLIILLLQYNQLISGAFVSYLTPANTEQQPIIAAAIEKQPVLENNILTIPKIGIEANINWSPKSLKEKDMQEALETGVVYYPVITGATALPGQRGTMVLLGHSSGDFFAPGQFKYVFALLNKVDSGDLFYITYNGTRYIYQVDSREIISPNEIKKIIVPGDKPFVTLITCDPPGNSIRRLLIHAEQISPDPSNAPVAENIQVNSSAEVTGGTSTVLDKIFGR